MPPLVPAVPPQVRVALHSAGELAAALDAAPMDVDAAAPRGGGGDGSGGGDTQGAADGTLVAYDRVINALGEGRSAVRALIKANTGGARAAGGRGRGRALAPCPCSGRQPPVGRAARRAWPPSVRCTPFKPRLCSRRGRWRGRG